MAVTSDVLASYLGIADIDTSRADLLIGLAESLCETIVSPLTDAADAIVFSAAGRAYTNPSGATTEMAGPYSISRPSAGVYLTKAERATLRRLAGGGGAFSIDLLGDYAATLAEVLP